MKSNLERIKHMAEEMRDMLAIINDEANGILNMVNEKEFKVLSVSEIIQEFGEFKYTEAGGGRITVTDNWRNENIIGLEINYKKIWCNKKIAHQFAGAFADMLAAGLWDYLDIKGGGCYCARHKCWDIDRSLSSHSWGIAHDFNPKKYPYSSSYRLPDNVISIFKKWGFYYGGDFTIPDPMHFEWCQYVI